MHLFQWGILMYLQLSEVSLQDSNPSQADIRGNVPNTNEFIAVLQVNNAFPHTLWIINKQMPT